MTRTRLFAGVLVATALAGCAESKSTATVTNRAAGETVTVDVPPAVWNRARALVDAALADPDGWNVGVVLTERPASKWWSVTVMTRGGLVMFIDASADCDGKGGWSSDEVLRATADPGDLIRWSGRDDAVCATELQVVTKGAALTGAGT